MSTATDVDALRRMMPSPESGGRAVDWDGMAQSWGRPFPLDYQRGMAKFLTHLFQGAFPECPLGDHTLWAQAAATFKQLG
ncbi:hypothetical protein BJY14_005022 [Actinomadura luteofluorescens]|uniref:Uncharacterized protein n=1 Tax=Actinomadura luteofluorescens TaxID=46163 RepID=A0A7Y9EJP8_9ACTN|nr:hypothetical protein [Actinomadura luteofluorescens]NYD49039.1 hypothetical protein [Actinomadura luteofluorescens]